MFSEFFLSSSHKSAIRNKIFQHFGLNYLLERRMDQDYVARKNEVALRDKQWQDLILVLCKVTCVWKLICSIVFQADEQLVSKLDLTRHSVNERRYLLYDVNPGEGFNLRRDVYVRLANLVRVLRESGHNVILVLPPWGGIYHWQTENIGKQIRIPWRLFFDVQSLNRFVPVIEFEQYIEERGRPQVDVVYYLQAYAEGWTHWQEKWHYRPCIDQNHYYRSGSVWKGWFFGYEETTANQFHCVSIQGHASTLKPLILTENKNASSIMIDRAETILHDVYDDVFYWKARRSMQYNKDLVRIGDEYRRKELNSTDDSDHIIKAADWTKHTIVPGQAIGGSYFCLHWRRRDFSRARGEELPSVKGTAQEIQRLSEKLGLNTAFLATDAPDTEVDELIENVPSHISVKRFLPSKEVLKMYKDGGVAIIDQYICAHARYFTGSYSSTFSFRIQEDREILGFPHDSTFNRMCPDQKPDCQQPSKWLLKQ